MNRRRFELIVDVPDEAAEEGWKLFLGTLHSAAGRLDVEAGLTGASESYDDGSCAFWSLETETASSSPSAPSSSGKPSMPAYGLSPSDPAVKERPTGLTGADLGSGAPGTRGVGGNDPGILKPSHATEKRFAPPDGRVLAKDVHEGMHVRIRLTGAVCIVVDVRQVDLRSDVDVIIHGPYSQQWWVNAHAELEYWEKSK